MKERGDLGRNQIEGEGREKRVGEGRGRKQGEEGQGEGTR